MPPGRPGPKSSWSETHAIEVVAHAYVWRLLAKWAEANPAFLGATLGETATHFLMASLNDLRVKGLIAEPTPEEAAEWPPVARVMGARPRKRGREP